MAVRKEDTAPKLKDIQIGCSWIPSTLAKPHSTEQQLICANWQENHLVHANRLKTQRLTQANQINQPNCSESGSLPGDYLQETQCQIAPACYDWTNPINVSGGFDTWQASEAANSHVHGNNSHSFDTWQASNIANSHFHEDNLHSFNSWQASQAVDSHVYGEDLCAYKFSVKDADKWTMPFGNPLELAHVAGTIKADIAVTQTDFIAASGSSALHFHPQNEDSQLRMSTGNSSMADLDSLLGAKFKAQLNSIPDILRDGSSIPSRLFFDLNSPPRTITDAALSKSMSSQFVTVTPEKTDKAEYRQESAMSDLNIMSSQFEPITPEKTNKAEYRQESAMSDLNIDEMPTAQDAQENKISRDEVKRPHNKKDQSRLVIDQLCANTPTPQQENHKPDKGHSEESDLSKTPQQKPRRRKHRPKVIIEGQPKSTPKSSAEKPTVPQKTTRVKKKYVHRKGENMPNNTPSEGENNGTDSSIKVPSSKDTPLGKRKYERRKGIDKTKPAVEKGTTETSLKSIRHTRSSCRRSLNFRLESQLSSECSSCYPSSNCHMKPHAENFNVKDQSRTTVLFRQGMEVMTKKIDMGIAYELTGSANQVLEDYLSRPEKHSRSPLLCTKMDPLVDDNMLTDQSVCTTGKCHIIFSDVTHDKEANTEQVTVQPNGQWTPKSPSDSNCSTCLTQERQVGGLKGQSTTIVSEFCNTNATGTLYNSLQAYLSIFSQNVDNNYGTPGMHFPATYKKKRTERGLNRATSSLKYTVTTSDNHVKLERQPLRGSCTKLFTSRTNWGSSVAPCRATHLLNNNLANGGTRNEQQIFEGLLALGPTKWIKKKRSKVPTRVRDLASLINTCKELRASPSKAATKSRIGQHTCMEALVADIRPTMTTKKRSKRSMLINSTVQNFYNYHKFSYKSMGPPLAITWKCMSPIDSVIEKLNQLDLNAKSSQISAQKQNAFMAYHVQYEEQHALVPYQKVGAVVPFDSLFDQVRRRRPRPKVDLDDETTRVWKLLLENINSEGIDGTDEERKKWWEEERIVFNGRADSFIARMHLIQGDRRFSPWKGSVVDSIVGVFLTQNVSDHLSSSAFMSLAAHFPFESKTNLAELHDEKTGNKVKEPQVCVLDPDETFRLNKELLNKSVCGEDPKMLQDFEYDDIRMVNIVESSGNNIDGIIAKDDSRGLLSDIFINVPVVSCESIRIKSMSLNGDQRDMDDTLSSQNSADSPIVQTSKGTESCLPITSEEKPTAWVNPNRFSSFTSFVKLLQMAGTVLHGVSEKGSDKKMSDENGQAQSERLTLNLQNEDHFVSPALPIISCSKSTLCMEAAQEPECFDLFQKNIKLTDTTNRKGLCAAEVSGLSAESAPWTTFQKVTAAGFKEEPKFSSPNAHSSGNHQIEINQNIVETQTGQVPPKSLFQENKYKIQEASNSTICPQNLMDVTGSSSNVDHTKMSKHKEVNSKKNDPDYHPGRPVNGPKAKGGRIVNEKQNTDEWDGLRKQAQIGGRIRERTANTMDSVDWDAVRCADVNEIAQTIKERGMNNMLAERIKDFLNRLVRDHGSIDLEWLRDIPPDKAKEYLLSIRGLGLKSVECVRLLTLHQLAFPVDTNVGRIAVRLGWVPLQPLPESLQLHLLELYPVLESIQKYLWPRLCKLDQRTLYELHYQMITFGKVFCTKSKPNCNACPMRGECRHFASAFASARFALPAPEEKSSISATENKAVYQKSIRSMNTLQLPLPLVNQMDAKSVVSNSQPIIEEPATPEPIIEVPATPEPGYTQVPECDIENTFCEDPGEIPTIQLNMEEFTHNLQKIMQQNTELQEGDMSKALVALTSEAASIPVPKLKNVSRLRTEHQVYELPDSHPLLEGMDKREQDHPCPYLLAIWTPGETLNSTEPPERQCSSQESEKLCTDETCLSCNGIREANSQTVRGTLLIPCRTAMRGSFPLNGTYFQVNEVFSDHESSLSPMDVPRKWLWNLPRRTVYFGTSIPTIFKGLSTEGIQYCFWRGFVCVRGFDRIGRAPRPLIARLHFPASKLSRGKGTDEN